MVTVQAGRRMLATGLVAALLWTGVSTQRSGAQDANQLEQQYDDALADEAQVRADYDAAVAKQFELATEIQTLDTDIASTQGELDDAQRALDQASLAAADTDARLADTEKQLTEEEARFRRQAIAAYVSGGASPLAGLDATLDDGGAVDAAAKGRVYSSVVVVDRDEIVRRYRDLQGAVQRLRDEAEARRGDAQQARDTVSARFAALADQRAQRQQSSDDAAQAAALAQLYGGQLEQRRREYEVRYAELATQSDSIREELATRQKDQLPAATTFGIFLDPVKDGPVVSGYGMRLHPILDVEKMHTGLDIDGAQGTPLRASADGVVVSADERGGYGLVVVIDHGNQLATVYAHMSSFAIRPGDVVSRGDVIGAVGSTGMATGPHCHWEVRVLGVPVDGTPYLSTAPG